MASILPLSHLPFLNPIYRISLANPIRRPDLTFPLASMSAGNISAGESEAPCISSDAPDSTAAINSESPAADVLVQYVVLRRDLIDSWPLGSVVTQGCHASVAAIWLNKDDIHTQSYCSPSNLESMHKVTLEVKGETQIKNLSEKLTGNGISHKLWIEQPENIPTCLATKPYPKSIVSSFFKKLKLCK
ncbi:putative peptidyl-tRNA hydrolase PTRHD1 [Impatiens glandulifera]|uniref:putative peptidyl-tRNA hydrolase PTRHD1 n=1 Tax=Impatiens glandulifera TaxID=253017 RepID=UPI001FB14E25|nr:putative peptidyl-tRNA hydrolase PTRHD1 [Impatiens glandulifera]